ncbi:serine/threonine protein phosphatase [Leptospira kobayashii]|uniref:Serine/threonine protein phosphatase n=1 Tax=Leptospira kobayashii TaxID=1917830 RepID=A0ABM7UH29_9LEPT|nr:metallophosphoesterase [Leptospira kobayashii]BDA77803.1 serine/threonine protein phosphatase [Leptospira kobayashii]
MTNIISIGDIHGRSVWKNINPAEFEKIVFVGDYVDSYDLSDEEIIQNLEEIIRFKLTNLDKVVLLLGNHDLMYLYPKVPNFFMGGYRNSYAKPLQSIFLNSVSLFQIAYQYDHFLWTHAGVNRGWYEANLKTIEGIQKENNIQNFGANVLSVMWEKGFINELASIGPIRGGRERYGGIFWSDYMENLDSENGAFLPGFHQIVGHSRLPDIETLRSLDGHSSVTHIDCLDRRTKFYQIEI